MQRMLRPQSSAVFIAILRISAKSLRKVNKFEKFLSEYVFTLSSSVDSLNDFRSGDGLKSAFTSVDDVLTSRSVQFL